MVISWAAWLADLRVEGHARRDCGGALSTPANAAATADNMTSVIVSAVLESDEDDWLGRRHLLAPREPSALIVYNTTVVD